MDPRPRAWILNFDAEAELADPSAHTPPRARKALFARLAHQVRALRGPGDVVLDGEAWADGYAGRAWCPTPRALSALARAGASVPEAPPLEVIRRVNHRRFCAELGQPDLGPGIARYVTTAAELSETLATRAGVWVLKRPLGFAGRERLRVTAGAIEAAPARWIAASLATGEGLQVEPWVERAGDFALHGHLSPAGELTLGEPTEQRCDAVGAWIESERAAPGALSAQEHEALVTATREAAAALTGAGYFGPFGVDAFRYRCDAEALRFNPRCEINARYSMGWAVGMGSRRPDL